MKTIAQVLDLGKTVERLLPGNAKKSFTWCKTEGENFQLFVDGDYIATFSVEISHKDELSLILVSTFHTVELRGKP